MYVIVEQKNEEGVYLVRINYNKQYGIYHQGTYFVSLECQSMIKLNVSMETLLHQERFLSTVPPTPHKNTFMARMFDNTTNKDRYLFATITDQWRELKQSGTFSKSMVDVHQLDEALLRCY